MLYIVNFKERRVLPLEKDLNFLQSLPMITIFTTLLRFRTRYYHQDLPHYSLVRIGFMGSLFGIQREEQ